MDYAAARTACTAVDAQLVIGHFSTHLTQGEMTFKCKPGGKKMYVAYMPDDGCLVHGAMAQQLRDFYPAQVRRGQLLVSRHVSVSCSAVLKT